MTAKVTIFKATRQELYVALLAKGLTGDLTWKVAGREQMITIAAKNDINHVPAITGESAMLKNLSKVFTPSFFKQIKELEIKLKEFKQLGGGLEDSEDTEDLSEEDLEPELELELAVKKN